MSDSTLQSDPARDAEQGPEEDLTASVPRRSTETQTQQGTESNGAKEDRAVDSESNFRSPRDFSKVSKWLIAIIVCQGSLCVTFTSSIYTAAYPAQEAEFGVSEVIAVLGLSSYVMGLGIGPALLAPLSEFYGRKPIYMAAFFFFTIWAIPIVVGKNIETLIIGRFFQGFSGSAFLSVAGGSIGDLFTGQALGAPMMLYSASPFVGPVLGPLLGNYIVAYADWRWTIYIIIIWGALNFASFCVVPETYLPVLQRRAGLKKDDVPRNAGYIFRTVAYSCLRPLQLLAFDYMITVLCLFSAILLGILYLFFESFPIVYVGVHGFAQQNEGLAFLGIFVGMVVAVCTQPLFNRWHRRNIRAYGKDSVENRLLPSLPGGVFVAVGMIWFAFTVREGIHYLVSIVASAFFGAGICLSYTGIFTYTVASYPLYAASGLAANSMARSTFAAVFPIFGIYMFRNLGPQWANAILALLTVIMVPWPFVFYKYGPNIRAKSRYARGDNER